MSSQDLNQSRFLFEELNLEDEPTQEEVLQRAEELEIEDLNLARQSLIRELDPEWKPYCNRKGEIYYINFLTKKAYVDHPIDMLYKQIYAKQEGTILPKFKSYRIEDIAQSMHLIKQEIQSYQNSKFQGRGLNIVYEEPSQQEKQSIYRSASQKDQRIHEDYEPNVNNVAFLGVKQEEELHAFYGLLLTTYQKKLNEYKDERTKKYNQLQLQTMKRIKQTLNLKIREQCILFEQQIETKNQHEISKIINSLQEVEEKKEQEYQKKLKNFKQLFQEFREKQRNIEKLQEEIMIQQQLNLLQATQLDSIVDYKGKIQKTKGQLISQFNQKLIRIAGTSHFHQQQLKKDLDLLFKPKSSVSYQFMEKQRQNKFKQEIQPIEIYKPFNIQEFNRKSKQEDKLDKVWDNYNGKTFHSSDISILKSRMPLLNRLQLRII